MAGFDRTTQDSGNVISLDHLNLTVADQPTAILFYIVGLGLTRDPYLTVGLENMWLNAGRQQFHVPTATEGQVVRGEIGLVVPDLDELEERLAEIAPRLDGTRFAYSSSDGHLDVTCPWGNRFRCVAPGDDLSGARFGVPYIEFSVPVGTAAGIARFYGSALRAQASVVESAAHSAAVIQAGPDQSLVFREDPTETRPYDGHHLAVYLADFSGPHAALDSRGLITEETNAHQYRFNRIVDIDSGELLYEIEHEVRSMRHPMFQRPLVNRDPSVTTRNYGRGAEYLRVG
jgi:hypothetical protein